MSPSFQDAVAVDFINNARAPRILTDAVILKSLQIHYPDKHVIIVPEDTCNILSFANSGEAIAIPDPTSNGTLHGPLQWHMYTPPSSRLDGSAGGVRSKVIFGKFIVSWNNKTFHMYLIDGRDGDSSYPQLRNQYIIATSPSDVESLILAAGSYSAQLHEEIFVYDQGWWQKDPQLWKSIQKSLWENVILDEKMKKGLIDDISGFYSNRATYENLGVPWKRGLIFHGPPGNGKTISIKAAMNMLYKQKDPKPTLYVKTLANAYGPEHSLNDIFTKARAYAPCFLIFEDLDSMVTDNIRSFFLNQVDGLASNDGILMIGSTNHLERLDPGISKRPSRFDRKYFFPNPSFEQRVQYAEFWRHKILKDKAKQAEDGDDDPVEFPEEMCKAVAGITGGFSFAYIQEAFLASLLQLAIGSDSEDKHEKSASLGTKFYIVNEDGEQPVSPSDYKAQEDDGDEDELEKYVLWRQFKKQVKILKDQMGNGDDQKRSSVLPPIQMPKIAMPLKLSKPAAYRG